MGHYVPCSPIAVLPFMTGKGLLRAHIVSISHKSGVAEQLLINMGSPVLAAPLIPAVGIRGSGALDVLHLDIGNSATLRELINSLQFQVSSDCPPQANNANDPCDSLGTTSSLSATQHIQHMHTPNQTSDGMCHTESDNPLPVKVVAVSMGNPHCVVFLSLQSFGNGHSLSTFPVAALGKILENSPHFPRRTNVEFVRVVSPTEVEQRTWERGVGETFACGTGACAVCVAGSLLGLLDTTRGVTVRLKGGSLFIRWPFSSLQCDAPPIASSTDDVTTHETDSKSCSAAIQHKSESVSDSFATGDVLMTGPARSVYEGTLCSEFVEFISP